MLGAEQQKRLIYFLEDLFKLFLGLLYTFWNFVFKILIEGIKMVFSRRK